MYIYDELRECFLDGAFKKNPKAFKMLSNNRFRSSLSEKQIQDLYEMAKIRQNVMLMQEISEYSSDPVTEKEVAEDTSKISAHFDVTSSQRLDLEDLEKKTDSLIIAPNLFHTKDSAKKINKEGKSFQSVGDALAQEMKNISETNCGCYIMYLGNVKYHNPLLNNNDLLLEFQDRYGHKATSGLITLTSELISDYRDELSDICRDQSTMDSFALLMGINEDSSIDNL